MDTSLLEKYGVNSAEELDHKIEEHLGTTWGAEDKLGGGYLGSARREVTQLKQESSRELEAKDQVIKKVTEDHQRFIERMAQLIGSPADENSLIEFGTKFSSSLDDANGFKDRYEREVESRKQDMLTHQEELKRLNDKINDLKQAYDIRIENLQKQVDEAIGRAQVAEEALSTATKFSSFWKWISTTFGNTQEGKE